MVSKKMDKLTICKTLYFSSAQNNSNMLETFLFADINIIYQKISPFFKSLVQVIVDVIKTSVTFSTKFKSNAGSFSSIVKQGHQAPRVGENKANKIGDNIIIGPEGRFIGHETRDGYIKQKVCTSSSSRNKVAIIRALLYMLSYLCDQQSNLLQIIIGYFLFANNVPKGYVKSLHQMGIVVSSKIVWQVLNINIVVILKNL